MNINDGAISSPSLEVLIKSSGHLTESSILRRPILATAGLATCVALCGYDSAQKTGFLIHYAGEEEVRPLLNQIKLILGNLGELDMTFYIIWVDVTSLEDRRTVRGVRKRVKSIFPERPIYDVTTSTSPYSVSFALDTRDGKTYCLDDNKLRSELNRRYN